MALKITAEGEAVRLAVLFFRKLNRWSQREFAAVAGKDRKLLSLYERGLRTPRQRTLEHLAVVAGVSPARLDEILSVFRQIYSEVREAPLGAAETTAEIREPDPEPPADDPERRAGEITSEIVAAIRPLIQDALSRIEIPAPAPPPPAPPILAREKAAELWDRLSTLPARHWRRILEEGVEYQTWSMCERFCEESLRAGRRDAGKALELAELALTTAERAPGTEAERHRRQGYAWTFVAHAHQEAGERAEAEEAFRLSEALWRVGEASPLEPLDEARVFGLNAALRPN